MLNDFVPQLMYCFIYREELGDKLSAGAKVSVLVFKDGDVINLIRVIENDDGSYHPYNEKSSSSPTRLSAREDGQVGFYNKLQENNTMLAKLTELRKKIADVSLKRHFKNSKPVDNEENVSVGCIGEKPSKESEEDFDDPKDDKTNEDSGFRYALIRFFVWLVVHPEFSFMDAVGTFHTFLKRKVSQHQSNKMESSYIFKVIAYI